MDLGALDRREVASLASQYGEAGMLVLSGVRLPQVFSPPSSDVVFLEVAGGCEVYIDAAVAYRGPNEQWRGLMSGRPDPGGTRRVLEGQPGFIAAVNRFLAALSVARVAAPPREPVAHAQRNAAPEQPRGEPRRRPEEPAGLRDLVAQARSLPERPVYEGRERELRALMTNLLRETKPGVVIVGSAGVGKTTLVRMLAAEIAWNEALSPGLADTPIYDLPLGSLLEDVRAVGDLERRLRDLLERPGRPIFFLDEIHQLMRPELAPLRDLLKPALAEGTLRAIGASTVVEWGRVRDKAFERRFLELRLVEPNPEETYRMMGPRLHTLERHHALGTPDEVLREAVMLADRYLPARSFPDKAIDLLDHAAALQRSEAFGPGDPRAAEQGGRLERRYLIHAVAAQTGLDPALLDAASCSRLVDGAIDSLHARLHGQDESFERIGRTLRSRVAMGFVGWPQAMRTLRSGWDRRPLACFLACGPTGVGKTETARVLAETFFDGRLIVLNGSDVGPEARHGVAMWTGSPPGYVGSDQGGVLTNGLRTHGTALILVDEVEKASLEAVQNVLLPLLGEGTVSDRNTGETLVAADCIVFCTSNIQPVPGAPRRGGLGFGGGQPNSGPESSSQVLPEELRAALEVVLRPEILGRFHAILSYRELDAGARWRIFEGLLRDLERQLGEGARVEFDAAAIRLVEESIAAQRSGARGIHDLFRDWVLPLAVGREPGDELRLVATGGRLAADGP